MRIEGQYTVPGPREQVWALLLDPEGIRQCLPGCVRIGAVGENQYEATLKIGIAAVRGTYVGKVQITDIRPLQGYTMAVEGSGKAGFVRGRATLDLEDQGGNTLVKLGGEAQVGGLVASVGQRMLGGVAKMMMGEFFTRLSDQFSPEKSDAQRHGGFVQRFLRSTEGGSTADPPGNQQSDGEIDNPAYRPQAIPSIDKKTKR